MDPKVIPKETQKMKPEVDIAKRKKQPGARKKRLRKIGEGQKVEKGKLVLNEQSRNSVTIPVDERSSSDE